jgi:hypothetical protein
MVTTAATLPLFIVIVLGIWWLTLFMFVRFMSRQAVNDAALYISDQARYWNINPNVPDPPPVPADWYDQEARRIVINRLRDILPYGAEVITNSLAVTVTEPLVATGAIADKPLCDPDDRELGNFRPFEEYGFMVVADFEVPFWNVRIPHMTPWNFGVRFKDRAVGYVQCPRWTGKDIQDDSKRYSQEVPSPPNRRPTPGVTPPTVTAVPSPTGTATETPGPSPTPTQTPTPVETP